MTKNTISNTAFSTPLKEGFSTGSAATAASVAALHLLFTNNQLQLAIINTPKMAVKQTQLTIPILAVKQFSATIASATVEKDGGDDPDATHKAHITATVTIVNPATMIDITDTASITGAITALPTITIRGGEGVGQVTLPGLPIPVGNAAINPAPLEQITTACVNLANKHKYSGIIDVKISVENGAGIAKKTLNPRLGIIDGISILGTQGTVKPFSATAWQDTVQQGLLVAKALNLSGIAFSTGRRSERLLMNALPQLSEQSFIQAADFVEFSLKKAGESGFRHIHWGAFLGKMIKLAMGLANTHAQKTPINMNTVALWCQKAGIPATTCLEIQNANTAGHVFELIQAYKEKQMFFMHLLHKAQIHAYNFFMKGAIKKLATTHANTILWKPLGNKRTRIAYTQYSVIKIYLFDVSETLVAHI